MSSSDVQFLGPVEPALDYLSIMHGGLGSTPAEMACAEKVKAPTLLAGGCTLGMVGTGLFGVYKLFKGKPATGVTAFVGAGVFYIIGAAFATAATKAFEACLAPAEQPKLPAAGP